MVAKSWECKNVIFDRKDETFTNQKVKVASLGPGKLEMGLK